MNSHPLGANSPYVTAPEDSPGFLERGDGPWLARVGDVRDVVRADGQVTLLSCSTGEYRDRVVNSQGPLELSAPQ